MRIADFHNDIITETNCAVIPDEYFNYHKVVTALFRGGKSFKQIYDLASKSNSPYLAFEDVGYDDLNFNKLCELKPIYVGLTWNGENRFGFGCNYKYGLKNEGLNLIKKLNASKITVDTAHISKGGFLDIIENADNVINSHTCFSRIYEHKRNIEDWQIKLLTEKKALIGITFYGSFMTNVKTCKITDLIKNIDYFCQRYPIELLCFGTDFYGCNFLPDGITEDYDSFYLLSNELLKRGYTEADIKKIFYGNLSAYLEKYVFTH